MVNEGKTVLAAFINTRQMRDKSVVAFGYGQETTEVLGQWLEAKLFTLVGNVDGHLK